jgi:hypothetical protein
MPRTRVQKPGCLISCCGHLTCGSSPDRPSVCFRHNISGSGFEESVRTETNVALKRALKVEGDNVRVVCTVSH